MDPSKRWDSLQVRATYSRLVVGSRLLINDCCLYLYGTYLYHALQLEIPSRNAIK